MGNAQGKSAALSISVGELATDSRSVARLRRRVIDASRPGWKLPINIPHPLSPAEIAVLAELASEARQQGRALQFNGLNQDLSLALDRATESLMSPESGVAPSESLLERVGEEALRVAADLVGRRRFVGRALEAIFIDPWLGRNLRWGTILEQMELIGVRGTPIVVFISMLVGIVLALNGANELRQFGASIFIANLVGVSMTREMGPLMTAVIVAGRSGSSIAAELGTMVVSEEIDAMETMALPPSRFLLAPRLIALLITVPCLTVLSDVAGVIGGYLVGVVGMGLGSGNYLHQTSQALRISDLVTGLIKSMVFALLIGLISSYEGLQVSGGAQGVGAATTRAVVASIVAAIIADAVFTMIFYFTG